jgi:hypothetical protein
MSPPSRGQISVPANRYNRRTHQRGGDYQDGLLRLGQEGPCHQEATQSVCQEEGGLF